MVESGETQDCPDHLWESSDKDSDGVVTWDEFDDSKGTILERPADDHTAPAWLAPDAAESDLGPLQKKLNVKCWLRPIVDEEAEDEKPVRRRLLAIGVLLEACSCKCMPITV